MFQESFENVAPGLLLSAR